MRSPLAVRARRRARAVRLPPEQWFPAGRSDIAVRRVALADGLTCRVLEAGPADGTPVVLLHGWAVSAYIWRYTIPGLAQAGFRVYAPDLPGHGLSDVPSGPGTMTLPAMAWRVTQLLDALDVPRAALVGHSMGGKIACEVAMRWSARVSRLVLLGPVGFGTVAPIRAFAPFVPALPGPWPSLLISRRMIEVVARRVQGKLDWFTERDIDEYWAPTQFPDVVRGQLQLLREFDWVQHDPAMLAALHLPVLVMFGTLDRTVRPADAARLVAALPEGRLEWVAQGGHVVMEEVPNRTNRMLIEFLSADTDDGVDAPGQPPHPTVFVHGDEI